MAAIWRIPTRRGQRWLARDQAQAQINAMETILPRLMCLGESEMGVHRQIFVHGNVRVEADSRQAKPPSLLYRVIYQLSPQTFTLSHRFNGNVVDEVCVGFGPPN